MTIPVVWLRKRLLCWDQAITNELLTNALGRTGYEFEHWVDVIPVDATGAVVVVPARYYESQSIDRFIAELEWVIVMLVSDEESLFDWRGLTHPNMRLWVMTPRPDRHPVGCARFVGEGYAPGTHELLATMPPGVRPWRWFLAGQITHARRQECAAALVDLDDGELVATPGFTEGFPQTEYLRRLTNAKVAPCPSGPATPDSFRLYEALEAGCVPIADAVTPEGWCGYWSLLLDDPPPWPVVGEWADAPAEIDRAVTDWPAAGNRAFAWWQQRKRAMVDWLGDDLTALGNPRGETLADLITVVVTTSPIPSHPSAAGIAATLETVRMQLPTVPIVIAADGVRQEQADMRADYEYYLEDLLWRANFLYHDTVPVIADQWLHQANLMRLAMTHVRTPLVLFVEHDTPIVGEVDWEGLCGSIRSGVANVIRLSYTDVLLPEHRYLHLDDLPVSDMAVPMIRTSQWSQRPHLAASEFYRSMIDTYFSESARTMIEDCLYPPCEAAWRERGMAGWDDWRLWLYTPPGNIRRSVHLDGRGDQPKWDMTFGYPGDVPSGAPQPT